MQNSSKIQERAAVHKPSSTPPQSCDGPGFRAIYEGNFTFVWRTLRRLGVPEADLPDGAQEVFVVVHRQLAGFEGRSKLTTWLFRICFHVARNRARRAHVRREVLEVQDDEPCGQANAEQTLERRRDLELLDQALAEMDIGHRAIFTLFELEELSGREIAELLELPLGTVYSKLRKARELIEERFRRSGRHRTTLAAAREEDV